MNKPELFPHSVPLSASQIIPFDMLVSPRQMMRVIQWSGKSLMSAFEKNIMMKMMWLIRVNYSYHSWFFPPHCSVTALGRIDSGFQNKTRNWTRSLTTGRTCTHSLCTPSPQSVISLLPELPAELLLWILSLLKLSLAEHQEAAWGRAELRNSRGR